MSDELSREEIEASLAKAQELVDKTDLWLGVVRTKLTPRDEDLLLCGMEAWLDRNHPDPQTRLSAVQSLGIDLYGRHIQIAANELIFIAQNKAESHSIRQACLDSWYEIFGIPTHNRYLKTIEEFFGE